MTARLVLSILPLLCAVAVVSGKPAYDPLAAPGQELVKMIDLTVKDTSRSRDIPLRVYLPAARTPRPVVLFSHGLGGSCKGNAFMGRHWAARGYVAVSVQHPGSDTSVWQEQPMRSRMTAMNAAANGRNFLLRVKDIPAVLDQLERWRTTEGHVLYQRLDLERIGMSGHSFGAVTTQAVSGQTFARRQVFTDPRIRAAIAFSPSCPRRGGSPERAFGQVKIPWMLMTGTRDLAPIGGADLDARLGVFPALPPGNKYELVLDGAEHSAFTERALPGDAGPRNPNHHRVILALSTAFWDAHLNADPAAKTWLDGAGPASVMQAKDRFQRK